IHAPMGVTAPRPLADIRRWVGGFGGARPVQALGRLEREVPARRVPPERAAGRPALAVLAARRRGLAGPAARRSASSSTARCSVTDSTLSALRREALVSPSVTYGPNRPSLITIGRLLVGSSPSSRS